MYGNKRRYASFKVEGVIKDDQGFETLVKTDGICSVDNVLVYAMRQNEMLRKCQKITKIEVGPELG